MLPTAWIDVGITTHLMDFSHGNMKNSSSFPNPSSPLNDFLK